MFVSAWGWREGEAGQGGGNERGGGKGGRKGRGKGEEYEWNCHTPHNPHPKPALKTHT